MKGAVDFFTPFVLPRRFCDFETAHQGHDQHGPTVVSAIFIALTTDEIYGQAKSTVATPCTVVQRHWSSHGRFSYSNGGFDRSSRDAAG